MSFDSNFTITNLWNAEITEDNDGHYSVSSELWTNPIPAGGSMSIGFIGEKNTEIDSSISNFSLVSIVVDDEEDVILPDLNTNVIDLGYIEDLIFAGMIDVIQDNDGKIRAIDGKFTNKTVNSKEDIVWILNAASTLFGERFSVSNSNISVRQYENEYIYRYSPQINGIPVDGSEIVIFVKNGEVTGLFSTYDNLIEKVNVVSQISDEEAYEITCNYFFSTISNIIGSLVAESGLSEEEVIKILRDSLTFNSRQIIYINYESAPELAWEVSFKNEYLFEDTGDGEFNIDFDDIYDYGKYILSSIHYTYYIKANENNAGEIVYIDDGICEITYEPTTAIAKDYHGIERNINVEYSNENGKYKMRDSERNINTFETCVSEMGGEKRVILPGIYFYSNDNIWPSNAVSAQANIALMYDYYKNVLGWEFDCKKGKSIKISVDYVKLDEKTNKLKKCENAYWDEEYQQFFFGNSGNFQAALDIIGHEYNHAAMENICGLDIKGEPGAMNEAYADIMGCLLEGKSDLDDGRWKFGEDSDRKYLRDIKNSYNCNKKGEEKALPVHYSRFQKVSNDNDDGGIHTNCAIFTLAAYKMMTDSRTTNVSDEEWTKLFFESMRVLSKNSHFIDGRAAISAKANQLGFTNDEKQAISDAFDEVGISISNIRIVLRWGATPSDLDSHLTGPTINGNGRFHIYYGNRNYTDGNDPTNIRTIYAADLDYDDTSSYGPEITSISTLTPGEYYFYVHDYSNRSNSSSTALSNSNANVILYRGSSSVPFKLEDGRTAQFTINFNGSGTLWSVCKIVITSDGKVLITPINHLSYHRDPSTIGF